MFIFLTLIIFFVYMPSSVGRERLKFKNARYVGREDVSGLNSSVDSLLYFNKMLNSKKKHKIYFIINY